MVSDAPNEFGYFSMGWHGWSRLFAQLTLTTTGRTVAKHIIGIE
jgi:hypothetical protein